MVAPMVLIYDVPPFSAIEKRNGFRQCGSPTAAGSSRTISRDNENHIETAYFLQCRIQVPTNVALRIAAFEQRALILPLITLFPLSIMRRFCFIEIYSCARKELKGKESQGETMKQLSDTGKGQKYDELKRSHFPKQHLPPKPRGQTEKRARSSQQTMSIPSLSDFCGPIDTFDDTFLP